MHANDLYKYFLIVLYVIILLSLLCIKTGLMNVAFLSNDYVYWLLRFVEKDVLNVTCYILKNNKTILM